MTPRVTVAIVLPTLVCERAPGAASVHLVVDDPDARYATAAATVVRPPEDTDYGSRQFVVADPEGNLWSLGTWYE